MNDGESIEVVIEGEENAAAGSSLARRTSDTDQRSRAAEVEVARMRFATARAQREAEFNREMNERLTAESEANAAEVDLERSADMGDYRSQAAANRRIARAEAKKLQSEQRQEYLQQAPVTTGDAFADHLVRHTDRTAQWMSDHRDWIVDPKKNAKVTGAHNFAVSEGLTPDTDEYFDFVEKMIGLRGNGGSNRGGRASVQGDHVVHRSGSDAPDGSVKMSKNAYEMATKVLTWNYDDPQGRFKRGEPIGVKEYLRRQSEMKKAGFYDRI